MDDTTQDDATAVSMDHRAASPVEMEIKPDKETSPADAPCAEEPLASRIEALILSYDRPLPESRLGELLGLGGAGTSKALRAAIDELNQFYASSGRAFRIEKLAGGWQMLTLPQFGPLLARLHTDRQSTRLSQAALETMSIIAYRQPIIRAEIEAIRGVACGEVLRGLLERRLIKIAGRAEELGRPMLYGTTNEFLKVFGLSRIDDLPEVEGLSPPARRRSKIATDDAARDSSEPVPEPDSAGADETPGPEKVTASDARPEAENPAESSENHPAN